MFVQLLVTAFIAGFVGVAVLGHVLLLQAIFTTKDNSSESADRKAAPLGPLAKA
jgi:hypothetical protein